MTKLYNFQLSLLSPGALHRRIKLDNFCHDSIANPFVKTGYAQKVLFYSLVFKKSNIFKFSHRTKGANYAEIDK